MPSEIELAMAAASDRMGIDAAAYRREIDDVISDLREAVKTVLVVYGGRDRRYARKLIKKRMEMAYARVRGLMLTMLRDLNYRHQVYLSEELGAVGGLQVRVLRGDSEIEGLRVMGESPMQWLSKVFTNGMRRAVRASGYETDVETATQIVDELTLGVQRVIFIFTATVDTDNKQRIISGMLDAVSKAHNGD